MGDIWDIYLFVNLALRSGVHVRQFPDVLQLHQCGGKQFQLSAVLWNINQSHCPFCTTKYSM